MRGVKLTHDLVETDKTGISRVATMLRDQA